ncbi:MAG: dihydrodipicolinate reductase [Armatimonadota bacterium]
MTDDDIRIVQYGIGAIGRRVIRLASGKSGMRIVGCVDVDEQLIGKDAGAIADLDAPIGVTVVGTLRDVHDSLAVGTDGPAADVCFHCTGSHLDDVHEQLWEIIEAGVNIVSTCEELSFPRLRQPDRAAEIDALARDNDVTVLGTGINPGFIMDMLPVALTAMCAEVRRVRVTRTVDVSTRRRQLQAKAGTGMTVAEFRQRAATGRMGHIGLRESLLCIAEALRWPAEDVRHSLEPVIAAAPLETEFFDVPAGRVAGLKERTWIERNGEEILTLELEMSVNAEDPRDTVELDGTPHINARVDGVHGDISTHAMVVNSARHVVQAPPGLVTMLDIPPVSLAAAAGAP